MAFPVGCGSPPASMELRICRRLPLTPHPHVHPTLTSTPPSRPPHPHVHPHVPHVLHVLLVPDAFEKADALNVFSASIFTPRSS
eukprot:350796-Chlamydomonas_euryale.AAC.10